MTSIDIYTILASKPHNPHYLKRYWKFIQWCQNANKILDESIYVEKHHIAPKAKDLFPQYAQFGKHQWNLVRLTSRQHILAHIMLWKVYGMSQVKALDAMLGEFSTRNCMNMREIPPSTAVRYAAKIRAASSGMATYYDKDENNYYIHRNDPRIHELNLLYVKCGTSHTEESKRKMSKAKEYMKTVDMYFLNCRSRIRIHSNEFEQYISQGWSTTLTKDDEEYTAYVSTIKKREKMKGRCRYHLPNGDFFGFLHKDDHRIREFNLSYIVTDNQKAQQIRRQELAVEANMGSTFYNDGKVNKKFKEDPGAPWIVGCIDWDRTAQKAASSKKRKDTFVINDGAANIYLKSDELIPEGWVRGMAPQKRRQYTTNVTWNNGVVAKKFPKEIYPGEGWVKGILKKLLPIKDRIIFVLH